MVIPEEEEVPGREGPAGGGGAGPADDDGPPLHDEPEFAHLADEGNGADAALYELHDCAAWRQVLEESEALHHRVAELEKLTARECPAHLVPHVEKSVLGLNERLTRLMIAIDSLDFVEEAAREVKRKRTHAADALCQRVERLASRIK